MDLGNPAGRGVSTILVDRNLYVSLRITNIEIAEWPDGLVLCTDTLSWSLKPAADPRESFSTERTVQPVT